MAKSRFLLDVRPRDADAPGCHDLHLDTDRLVRVFRGELCLDRLCHKTGMTRGEALRTFTPGACVDPATGEVSINAGYDPGFDEGAGRIGLPVGEQGAGLLQDYPAVRSKLVRCLRDHGQAGGGSTGGEQLVGGLDQQRQAGRRLGDRTGVEVRGAHRIAPNAGE